MLRFFRLFIVSAIFLLLVACNPTNLFVIQVTVTDMAGTPLSNAQIVVSGSGFDTPSTQFTDSLGIAIIELNANRTGAIALVRVTKDGYQPHSQHVNLNQTQIPLTIRLQKDNLPPTTLNPTQASSPEPTSTPSHTLEAMATNVPPVPTGTPTETATPTPTATPTSTPTPTVPVTTHPLIRVLESQVILYAGPSAQNVSLFIARSGDELIPFERTPDNNWLRVRESGTNVEGWTANDGTITWLQGNVADVPFSPTFTASIYPIDTEAGTSIGTGTPSVGGSCNMTITWQYEIDQMRIFWNNKPTNVRWLELTITDASDSSKYLVYPNRIDANDADTQTRGFSIPFTQFTDRGFEANSSFRITIVAQDSNQGVLCTRQVSFTR